MTWVQCMALFVGWLVGLCNNVKCRLHVSCRGFVVGWVGGLWQERKEHWPCSNVSHLTVRAFEDAAGCLSTVQILPPRAIQPVIPAQC